MIVPFSAHVSQETSDPLRPLGPKVSLMVETDRTSYIGAGMSTLTGESTASGRLRGVVFTLTIDVCRSDYEQQRFLYAPTADSIYEVQTPEDLPILGHIRYLAATE